MLIYNSSWRVHYYNEKVRNWVDKMPVGMKAYYARITERIEKYGPNLGMPFTRYLGHDLFEIRIRAKEGICRLFYCVYMNEVIILHGFIKKSNKIPKKEIGLAKQRLKEVKTWVSIRKC